MLTSNDNNNEIEFRQMCQRHDLSYQMSDDNSVWERGQASYQKILEYIHEGKIDREVAISIWNSVVDDKLAKDSREMFYWGVPTKEEINQ